MKLQNAPIHIATLTRKVLMQTSDTTSWIRSVMILSCFLYIHVLFSFCLKVK